ncbi:MAG: hypothetical protein H6741_09240 [Alphaproteobacteria bacterium]|nr:hypothetical protein [Alphaproteobacteria bacterium]MCB9792898.1 hypothetical protein [Alphaproteobacteria bacterium]
MRPLLIAALAGLSAAQAHRPAALAERSVVEDPKISWTFMGEFEDGLESFVLELSFDEPFALPVELLTPREARYELHRPWYAVVGPGLPEPSDTTLAVLPYALPEGWGVLLDRNDDAEREVYFETVTRSNLWSSGTTNVALLAETYEVWIWSPNLTTGPFQFAFGVEEDFSDADLGAMFGRSE